MPCNPFREDEKAYLPLGSNTSFLPYRMSTAHGMEPTYAQQFLCGRLQFWPGPCHKSAQNGQAMLTPPDAFL